MAGLCCEGPVISSASIQMLALEVKVFLHIFAFTPRAFEFQPAERLPARQYRTWIEHDPVIFTLAITGGFTWRSRVKKPVGWRTPKPAGKWVMFPQEDCLPQL